MVKTLTQLKRILIFAFVLFAASILVSAHSLYLFGISLDFDKDLKSNVIKSAQEFLKTGKEPLSFDLDKGLIMAHFEPEQKHYVEVNPADFKVYGMRDENLKHTVGEKKLTKEQGPEIAKKFFDTLPGEVKSELKYGSEASEVDGTYFYKWFRYVNGILVAGEDFMVNVDAVNGNIIAWRLPIFDYPKNTIDTTLSPFSFAPIATPTACKSCVPTGIETGKLLTLFGTFCPRSSPAQYCISICIGVPLATTEPDSRNDGTSQSSFFNA